MRITQVFIGGHNQAPYGVKVGGDGSTGITDQRHSGIQAKPPFYPLLQSLNQDENSKVIIFAPNQLEKGTAPDSETQSGDISVWWRRGRIELPVQKRLPRICYKLSQLFNLTWLTFADLV